MLTWRTEGVRHEKVWITRLTVYFLLASLCGVCRTYIHSHLFHRFWFLEFIILCVVMFNSLIVLSEHGLCAFALPVSFYALHKMDMNCPSVEWIHSFIYSSSSVVLNGAKERASGLEGLRPALWLPSYVTPENLSGLSASEGQTSVAFIPSVSSLT